MADCEPKVLELKKPNVLSGIEGKQGTAEDK